MTSGQNGSAPEEMLSGWKAIAKHLGRGVRTAQRYESEEMPIPEPVARLLRMFVRYGIPKEW